MNEIEEFLKRAAAMRARQQGGPPAPQAPAPRPTPKPAPAYARMPTPDVLDAEIVEAEAVSGDDVADYVSRHLDSSKFKQRSSQLGVDIKSTDEAIESHLQETFVHRLGQLGAATAAPPESTLDEDENAADRAAAAQATSKPTSLVDMIRSPQSLRSAIILSEILNPPKFRW